MADAAPAAPPSDPAPVSPSASPPFAGAPGAPPADPVTLAGGAPTSAPPPVSGDVKQGNITWPAAWREGLTSDPKEQERLARITDPAHLWKSYR